MRKIALLLAALALVLAVGCAGDGTANAPPSDIPGLTAAPGTSAPSDTPEAPGTTAPAEPADSIAKMITGADCTPEELAAWLYDYYAARPNELRMLPAFNDVANIEWDAMVAYVFTNVELSWNEDGYGYVTDGDFDAAVRRYFGGYVYTPADSSLADYIDGRYVSTGWGMHGMAYFWLGNILPAGDGLFTAFYDVIWLDEMDFYGEYEYMQPNSKAIYDYAGITGSADGPPEGFDLDAAVHDMLVSGGLGLFEDMMTVIVTFGVAEDIGTGFMYYACEWVYE